MTNDTFEQDATPRLNAISEELHKINTEIIANLESLPEQTALVGRLIERCDGISLELDALQMELGNSRDGLTVGKLEKAGSSADGSGLQP